MRRSDPQQRAAKAQLAAAKRGGRYVPNGSWQTTLVIDWLMNRPEVYGVELITQTALTGGTVYPILARLEDEGWVTSTRRPSPRPDAAPRIYYSLTEEGRRLSTAFLACHGHKVAKLESGRRPIPATMPAPAGGAH